ncbi:MAG: DUF4288 domain-containing protein [Deltaproteobacteria bacterium]|nr:DUF4288 domain-containing protein [Deltaproteobacteria bacterium]
MRGEMGWYSACARLMIQMDDAQHVPRYKHSVFVFKARDRGHAQRIAVALGKKQEAEYANSEGRTVTFRLVDVPALEAIAADSGALDSREIYAHYEEVPERERVEFGHAFCPERSDTGGARIKELE